MISYPDRNAAILVPLAAHLADGRCVIQQKLCGNAAQAEDDPGPHQFDLPLQVLAAVGRLLGQRIAVFWRAALDDVADVDVLAAHLHALGDDVVELLPGPADEGHSLKVLVLARRLADEHQIGLGRTIGKNRVGAGRGQFGTAHAAGHPLAQGFQVGIGVGRPFAGLQRRQLRIGNDGFAGQGMAAGRGRLSAPGSSVCGLRRHFGPGGGLLLGRGLLLGCGWRSDGRLRAGGGLQLLFHPCRPGAGLVGGVGGLTAGSCRLAATVGAGGGLSRGLRGIGGTGCGAWLKGGQRAQFFHSPDSGPPEEFEFPVDCSLNIGYGCA